MKCVYCLGASNKSTTKEHVISRGVLEAIFGKNNRNITRSEIFGNKTLIDHEQVVRDVCENCNNVLLSPYDSAGIDFANQIHKYYDATGVTLPVTFKSMVWLVKTHLNHIRIIPEKGTKRYYPISNDIYAGIIGRDKRLFKKFKLFIEGWQGLPYFWDENDNKKIQFFSYRSVHFPNQKILVSNFRIKWLDTFLLLPSDLDYSNFELKTNLTVKAMKANWGFDLQEIDSTNAVKKGFLNVKKIAKTKNLLKHIRKYET